jgi:lipid-A-disaccharide synthase
VDDVDDLVAAGARVQRVSHPLADDVTLPLAADRAAARRELGLTEDHSVVAVCATAGAAPLRALVPLVRDAVRQVQAAGEPLQVAIGAADPTEAMALRRLFGAVPGEAMQVGAPRTSVTAADVVICGDGETTLLAALLGTPALLARRRPWRERLARMVAPRLGGRLVPFDAWANRVAADAVVPELLDEACQAPRVAEEIVSLLGHAADQARRLADVRAAVRAERAWASIARLLIDMAVDRAGAAPAQPPTVNRNS